MIKLITSRVEALNVSSKNHKRRRTVCTERSKTLEGDANGMKSNYAIAPFIKRNPSSFWRFYLNRFYNDCIVF